MPNAHFSVNYRRPFAPPLGNPLSANGTPSIVDWWRRFIAGVDSGAIEADFVQVAWADDVAIGSNAYATPAAAMLIGATLTGPVGFAQLGPQATLTVTAAGGDVATLTALAAAVRANTTVNRLVTASQQECRLTLTTVLAGQTVRIFGQVFTAVATAADVRAFGDFNIDGADTADAAALALAINRHPSLAGRVVAISSASTVSIFLVEDRPAADFERITNPSAATIVVNVAQPTRGVRLAVIAAVPGAIGNEVRATATGTGATIATNNATAGLLGGGTGGVTPAQTWRGVP